VTALPADPCSEPIRPRLRVFLRLGAGPKTRFAALAVSAAFLLLAAGTPSASADTPTIVNTATVNGQGNWLTSFTTTGNDGDSSRVAGGRHIRLSLLVEHAPGRIVTGLKIDQNWNSSDESASSPTITAGLDVQQPNVAGGFNYSRVNYDFLTTTDAIPAGETHASGTLYVRAVLDDGSVSAPVSSAVNFLAAENVPGVQQNPFLFEWSSFTTNFFGGTTPGSGFSLGAVGKDPDPRRCTGIPPVSFCVPEALGGIEWRTRNQLTGATTATTRACNSTYVREDPEGNGVNAFGILPSRGTFAVEGELLDEEAPAPYSFDFECESPAGLWWPLGSVDVNSSSIPPPVLVIGPRPVVGGSVSVSAQMPTDPDVADGGKAEYVEWDLDGNPSNGTNGFDRTSLGPYQGWVAGTTLSQTIDTEGMTPGLKTARVRVTDNGAMSGADNVRATSDVATIQYRVDSPPVISPESVVHAAVDAPVSIPLSAEDADGDPITWSVSEQPQHGSGSLSSASGTSNTYTFTPDAGYAGTDSVTFDVADGWGGTSTRTVGLSFDPETSIDSASPQALTHQTDASFEFSSDTPGASFVCFLTGPGSFDYGPCTSPVGYSSLPDGEYQFSVQATKGKADDLTPPIYKWTIDATAPTSSIDSGPSGLINNANASFAFSGSDTGGSGVASFQCSRDGAPFVACTSPQAYSGLADGSHTLEVRATDQAGNVDQSPAGRSWSVDTTAPNTSIDSAPSGLINSPNASFTFSGADGGGSGVASFECRADSNQAADWGACASPKSYSALADGSHTFEVRATDQAGNVDLTPASPTWTIDTTAPETTIRSKPRARIVKSSRRAKVRFVFGVEPGASYECALDKSAFAGCASPVIERVEPGRHTFSVRAKDEAGNLGPVAEASFRFKRKP
jgi:hypothetical protein